MDDDALLQRLGHALDTAPAAPSTDRVTALRAEVARRAVLSGSTVRASRSRVRPWLAAAAAAIVALFAGAVVVERLLHKDASTGTTEYDGPMLSGRGTPASAELRIVATGIGRVVELDTDALPILPRGEYYELWFVAPDNTTDTPDRISAGTFHPDPEGRSDVRFSAAVDPRRFSVVEVTAEPGDGNPAPTGPIVLRAALT